MSQRLPTVKVPTSGAGALVASLVVSVKPCKLLALIALNTNASTQYIQVHETTTLPANGQVPALPAIPVATGSILMFDFGGNGVDLDALTICNSSTAATKTIGAADCSIVAILLG